MKLSRCIVLGAFGLLGTSLWADIVPVTNSNFSTPAVNSLTLCGKNYIYQSTNLACPGFDPPITNLNGIPDIGWVFANLGDGIAEVGGEFNPPAGSPSPQVGFLQGQFSSFSQLLAGPVDPRIWVVSFYLGGRNNSPTDGNQHVQVTLDNVLVGDYFTFTNMPFTLETTTPIALGGGSHTLEFQSLIEGDHTAFVTDVSVVAPEASAVAFLFANLAGFGLLGFGLLRLRRKA